MTRQSSRKPGRRFPSTTEWFCLMALMMAMAALPIDITLPALPIFVDSFSLANANTAQTIITTYMLGFALGQIFMVRFPMPGVENRY